MSWEERRMNDGFQLLQRRYYKKCRKIFRVCSRILASWYYSRILIFGGVLCLSALAEEDAEKERVSGNCE